MNIISSLCGLCRAILLLLCLLGSTATMRGAETHYFLFVELDGATNSNAWDSRVKYTYVTTSSSTDPAWPTSWTYTNKTMSELESAWGTAMGNAVGLGANGGAHLRLGNGTFATGGAKVFDNFDINTIGYLTVKGKGKTATAYQLKNGATGDGVIYDHLYVLHFQGTPKYFSMENLTLDCNWANQGISDSRCDYCVTLDGDGYISGMASPPQSSPYNCTLFSSPAASRIDPAYKCGFRVGAVVMDCVYGQLKNCKFINFGANSSRTTNEFCAYGYREADQAGVEAFVVQLRTGNWNQTGVAVTIEGCEATGWYRVKNGYCTVISIAASITSTNAFGTRTTPLGVLTNNYVYNVPDGIAYGLGGEQVIMAHNRADNCKAAFNMDTPPLINATINSNRFTVKVGLNFQGWFDENTGIGNIRDVTVSSNFFHITGRYFNTYLCDNICTRYLYPDPYWEPSYCIRLVNGVDGITITRNYWSSEECDKFGPTSNGAMQYYVPIWAPSMAGNPVPINSMAPVDPIDDPIIDSITYNYSYISGNALNTINYDRPCEK